MNQKFSYVCPLTKKPLTFMKDSTRRKGGLKGYFISDRGIKFPVLDNLADFIYPRELDRQDQATKNFYDNRAEAYDQYLHLTFFTHNEDEEESRKSFIERCNLNTDSKVLEIAAGTGRDSVLIADRLGRGGEFYITDISPKMMKQCIDRLWETKTQASVKFALANACYLPFPDNYFDATYSFGGLGEFSDIKGSLKEMARVTKVGGRIVVGDESIPPWLRGTDFARILITTNPQFEASLPLLEMPVEARNVCLRWVIGGAFYLIDFTVGNGEPTANFDFDIPGFRGGTYRTRYEGQLEGVTPEAKKLYFEAAAKTGKSLHKWLDDTIKKAAKKDLETVE